MCAFCRGIVKPTHLRMSGFRHNQNGFPLAAHGGKAVTRLEIAEAANYPKRLCEPVTADGFRVYPPGSGAALFVPLEYTLAACTLIRAHQFQISRVAPTRTVG
jgi:hypothetical protein